VSATRRSATVIASAVGLLVGIGYPLIDIAIACRAPASEACVWGKAYLSLTFGVSIIVLAPIAAGLVYALLAMRRNRPLRPRD
jgi:hypothetical protein